MDDFVSAFVDGDASLAGNFAHEGCPGGIDFVGFWCWPVGGELEGLVIKVDVGCWQAVGWGGDGGVEGV